MIIVILIVSILYLVMLTIILKAYYRDQETLEKRCLVLEKRIEDYRKVYNNYFSMLSKQVVELEDTIKHSKRNKK